MNNYIKMNHKDTNKEVRDAMYKSGVKQWELAEAVGLAESTMCRRFRKEFDAEEKEYLLSVIAELATKPRTTQNG